jgi:hypothetical protein
MEPPKKKQSLTSVEIALKLCNGLFCIIYAATQHNTDINHPFLYGLYVLGGSLIGNLTSLVGDLSIIGSLGFAMWKTYYLK